MNFKDKYLKYKAKYLKLKYQYGGFPIKEEVSEQEMKKRSRSDSISDSSTNKRNKLLLTQQSLNSQTTDIISEFDNFLTNNDTREFSQVNKNIRKIITEKHLYSKPKITLSEVENYNLTTTKIRHLTEAYINPAIPLSTFINLKSLIFADYFDQTLIINNLPSNLLSLTFGTEFNNGGVPFTAGILPQTLQSLTFGIDFNNGGAPFTAGILPQTLQSLIFIRDYEYEAGSRFNEEIYSTTIHFRVDLPITFPFILPERSIGPVDDDIHERYKSTMYIEAFKNANMENVD